jgi:hypothetical protein
VDQSLTTLGGEGVWLPSPRLVVLGLLFHIRLARARGGGGSLPLLPGMSWRDQQSSWVFEVGESLKGDDYEGLWYTPW